MPCSAATPVATKRSGIAAPGPSRRDLWEDWGSRGVVCQYAMTSKDATHLLLPMSSMRSTVADPVFVVTFSSLSVLAMATTVTLGVTRRQRRRANDRSRSQFCAAGKQTVPGLCASLN